MNSMRLFGPAFRPCNASHPQKSLQRFYHSSLYSPDDIFIEKRVYKGSRLSARFICNEKPIAENYSTQSYSTAISIFQAATNESDNQNKLWRAYAKKIGRPFPNVTLGDFNAWCEEHKEAIGEITDLNLSNLQLTALPAQISFVRDVQYLILSNNRLKSLPPELKSLIKIKYLCLNHNLFQSIPSELCRVFTLEVLTFDKNQISDLAEIHRLGQLRILSLNDNNLEELPDEIFAIASLEQLNLEGNRLKAIPSISNLAKLKVLRF